MVAARSVLAAEDATAAGPAALGGRELQCLLDVQAAPLRRCGDQIGSRNSVCWSGEAWRSRWFCFAHQRSSAWAAEGRVHWCYGSCLLLHSQGCVTVRRGGVTVRCGGVTETGACEHVRRGGAPSSLGLHNAYIIKIMIGTSCNPTVSNRWRVTHASDR